MTEAAQGQGQATSSEAGQATQGQEAQQGKTLTWEEHVAENKRVGAKEHKSGYSKRDADLLEKAREINPDIESIDDVLSGYSEYQGIQEAVTTNEDRLNTELEKAKTQFKAERELRISRDKNHALSDALRDSGINPERLNSAMRLANLSALEVDKEGNVSGLDDVVEAVREEAPEFFSDASGRPRVNAPQTSRTGIAHPVNGGVDPEQAHANALLRMFQNSP